LSLFILAVIVGAAINSAVFSQSPGLDIFRREKDKKAPVDYGFGPGAGMGPARPNLVLGQTPATPRRRRRARGCYDILARLDDEAGEPATRHLLVPRIAHARSVIGFVVADQKPVLGQCRD
jgi:hypothetical protein